MENTQYFGKQNQNDLHGYYLGSLVHCNGRVTIRKRSLFTKFLHINGLLIDVEWISREPLLALYYGNVAKMINSHSRSETLQR